MCFKIVGNEPADFVLFGGVVGSVHLDLGLVSSKPHASGSCSHSSQGKMVRELTRRARAHWPVFDAHPVNICTDGKVLFRLALRSHRSLSGND